VSGNGNVGGLVGSNSNGTITNGYWDTNTATAAGLQGVGNSNNPNVIGLSTSALASALPAGFTTGVWGNIDNQTTPYLLANASFGTVSGSVILGTDSSTTPTYYNVILSLNQLQNINSTGLALDYVLGGNIDASATSGWNSGAGFAPLGADSNHSFTGVFDGLGHTVSGLTIDRSGTNNVGLFGYVDGGILRNIGLLGDSVSGRYNVGGLVGYNHGGTIIDAYATGGVNGGQFVGGLVGYNTATGTISDAYATGNISGFKFIGGLVGSNSNGMISDAYATGSVSGSSYIGGLAGYNSNNSTIRDSYATGSVSGIHSATGGLVGKNTLSTIINAYATGSVSGNSNAGGLVGSNSHGTISNAYATGSVSGNSNIGALVGINSNGTINNGYWDTSTSGQPTMVGASNSGTIAGGGGLDTTHIMQQGSFSNFDFSNVWIIYGDHTAPLLRYFMTPLIVTSDNQTKTYNGSSFALSTVSYSVAGAGSSGHLYGLGSSYNGAKDASATAYAPDLWSDQQGYIISYVGGALTINPLAVVLTGSRTYNGSNGIAGSALSASNLISGDSLSLTGSGTLASKNAGSEAITSFSGLTLSNSNYTLTGASGSVTINPLALTLTLPDVTKTYDGTTGYTLSSTDLAGLSGELLSGDTVTGATVTYADKNAGIGNKTVTFSGVGISDGNGGGNYLLTLAGNTTSTIDQKALTVAGLTGTDKTYDGTTNDPLSGTAMFNGLIGTQTLTVAGTLASANASNQGVALMLMLSDGSNGGVASNYTLTQPTLAPVTIAQASLTVTGLTGTDKTYDGSTLDPLSGTAMLNGLVGTQTLTLGNDSTGTLASANAGSQGVTTALTLSDGDNGGLASNYALTQPTLANVTVYPGQAGPDVVPNTESGIGSAEKLMQGGYIVPVSGPSIWLNPMATYDLRAGFGKPTQVDLTVCTAVTSTPHLACNRTYHLDPFAVSAIIVGNPSLPQQPRGM
ncbi:MAG: YDG domain-containing protein, partial [Rhodanobacter sp.]